MLMSASTPHRFLFLGLPLLPVQVQRLLTSDDIRTFRSRPLGRASCLLGFSSCPSTPRALTFSGDFLCWKSKLASKDACRMPLQLLTGQADRRRFEKRVAVQSSDVLREGRALETWIISPEGPKNSGEEIKLLKISQRSSVGRATSVIWREIGK